MKTEYNSPTEEHNGSPYLYGPTVENLVSAIRGGADIRVIQRIMDSPILDVNEYDRDSGSYAYEAAIMMGRNDVAQLLLDNGAHVKGDENHPPSRKELEDEILIERVFGNKSLTEYGYINGEEERKNNPLRIYSEEGLTSICSSTLWLIMPLQHSLVTLLTKGSMSMNVTVTVTLPFITPYQRKDRNISSFSLSGGRM